MQGGLEISCMSKFTDGKDLEKKDQYWLNVEQDGLGKIEENALNLCSLVVDADDDNGNSDKDSPMTVDAMCTSVLCVAALVKTEPIDNDCFPESLHREQCYN